jgi:hypothetical protein
MLSYESLTLLRVDMRSWGLCHLVAGWTGVQIDHDEQRPSPLWPGTVCGRRERRVRSWRVSGDSRERSCEPERCDHLPQWGPWVTDAEAEVPLPRLFHLGQGWGMWGAGWRATEGLCHPVPWKRRVWSSQLQMEDPILGQRLAPSSINDSVGQLRCDPGLAQRLITGRGCWQRRW